MPQPLCMGHGGRNPPGSPGRNTLPGWWSVAACIPGALCALLALRGHRGRVGSTLPAAPRVWLCFPLRRANGGSVPLGVGWKLWCAGLPTASLLCPVRAGLGSLDLPTLQVMTPRSAGTRTRTVAAGLWPEPAGGRKGEASLLIWLQGQSACRPHGLQSGMTCMSPSQSMKCSLRLDG